MDLNPETLASLSSCFLNSLSPHPDLRRQAESALSSAADQPNFSLAVLSLLSSSAAAPAVRHAAAVNFKNHLRSRWTSSSQTLTLTLISEPEKQQIKTQIVPVMLASDTKIRVQLSEALAVVSKHDFPQNWPTLLPDLKNSLERAAEAADYATINGILGTINSIFKKFRYQYRSNELLLDLKYCLDGFAEPLLRMFKITARWIDEVAGSGGAAENLKVLIESQRLCCRIFFSLNFQDLPEFFEDHMGEWMGEFQKYLSLKYPSLEEGGGDGLALVDDLRAAVCENISLYLEKNEEEFIKYLSGFVESVWSLLVTVSASDGRDRLAVTGIKFLTTVSTSGHHTLFARDDILEQICKSIVIPNVMLRAEDEELFEFNHVEFIRRDMEGSDLDTRRRIACELLKGIAMNYREQVTRKVSSQIQTSLALFAENPATNWKHKDYVIYLVVSLATKRAGEVSTDLVDVDSFFRSVIVPELQNQDVNGFPMLKAGALKFFTTFRTLIPKPVALALVPDVVRLLCSESNVVHSYAASCIEKLLLVKNEGGQARYTSADIGSILPVLITNLFAAFGKSESEENQYVMKCIMRVLGVAEIATNIASECVQGLTSVLRRVCENPKTPTFNHYLFEAVAVLVRRSCERDPSLISLFEQQLFPSVQVILAQDVTEFLPYAFQLLAQLIELNRSSSIQQYIQIFYILLHPDSWTRSGNVPALVRLLQAFLQKAPQEIYQEKRLEQVLGIFEKLISSPSTVEQGFYILNTVIENLSYDAVAPYISHIWNALFTRLQSTKSVKFLKSLMIFMSLFLVKHGSQNLANTINSVHQNQPNLFGQILDHFWIPNLKLITGSLELKLAAVASTRLICESPSLLDPTASERWGKMLNSIVVLLSRTEQDRVEEEGDVPDFGENTGYGAAFVQLHNAGRKEEDPLKDIRDPKQYLVESLARLSALSPGRFPQIISANLDAANQAALLQLCSVYHFSIV